MNSPDYLKGLAVDAGRAPAAQLLHCHLALLGERRQNEVQEGRADRASTGAGTIQAQEPQEDLIVQGQGQSSVSGNQALLPLGEVD